MSLFTSVRLHLLVYKTGRLRPASQGSWALCVSRGLGEPGWARTLNGMKDPYSRPWLQPPAPPAFGPVDPVVVEVSVVGKRAA